MALDDIQYEMKKTAELASKVEPEVDSLVCGAVALLELALHNAPCSGPEASLVRAIDACKDALLFDYENWKVREDMR